MRMVLCWGVVKAQEPTPLPHGWRTTHIHEPRLAALKAQGVLSENGVNAVRATNIGIPLFTDTVAAVEWVNSSILRQLSEAFSARTELACRCNRANLEEGGEPLTRRGKLRQGIADRIDERSYRIAQDCRGSRAAFLSSCDTLALTVPGSVNSLFVGENSRLQRTASELGWWTCPDAGPDSLLAALDRCGLLDAEARATFCGVLEAQPSTSLELLQSLVSHYSGRDRKRYAERRMLALLDSLAEWGYLTHDRHQLLLEYAQQHTELPDHVVAMECTGAFEVRPVAHTDMTALVAHITDMLKEQMPMFDALNAAQLPRGPQQSYQNEPERLRVGDFPNAPLFLGPLNHRLCDAGSDMRVFVVSTVPGTSAPSPFVVLPLNERAFRAWMNALSGPVEPSAHRGHQPARYRPTIGTSLGRNDLVFSTSYCSDSIRYWQKCFRDWGVLTHVPPSGIDSVCNGPYVACSSVLDILEQFPASHVGLHQLMHHPSPYVEMLRQLSVMSNGEIDLTSAKEHRNGAPLKLRQNRQNPQHRPIRSVVFVMNGQHIKLLDEGRKSPMSTRIMDQCNLALREAGSDRRIVTMTGERWPCVFVNKVGYERLVQLDWITEPIQW